MPDSNDAAEQQLGLKNFRLLHAALQNATMRYRHATRSSSQRLAAVQALQAFIGYMDADAGLRAYQAPLHGLALALLDLDNGRTAPMLQAEPRATRGGPAISLLDATERLRAAYIADGLMKHAGMGLHDAAKWVAAKLAAAGHEVSFHTIIDWRKDANNPRKNRQTHERYRRLQKAGRAHWGEPLPYAETLIQEIIVHMQKGE